MTLKDYRKRMKLTQYEAAEQLNIHKDYLSMIERGKRTPSYKLLTKMAKLYQTTPEELFKTILNQTILNKSGE
ncbi:helix-turn-helix transcriptional regulator [Caldicellulosiruptor acetigenus]|uniref:helix-turn-helix domain-containing protein n=1 Tax=Caldicellulosiruptor acetigenus TaxID=301953 RepID=UPI0022A9B86E|nr:helix-turn-helix transcriptional regulator [Caldicellulosiruptor acetigenus]WAM36577.1 helix-turn-helix transcriptional regulator [Caldicellulosiruptor acetigenus]